MRGLPPEMRESGGWRVLGSADIELFGDALAELLVDHGDAGLAVEFDEGVALGHAFEFALDHGLVANEGPVEVVREGHVAAGFPIADGLGFLEFAGKSGFRADIEPEGKMRAEGHGIEASEIVAVDAANDAAGNEREDEAVGEDHGARPERGDDAMLELVEEVGGVHQSESETSDGVFGKKFVNVAADKIGAAEAAGHHGEAFGFEPFLEQGDLRGAARTIHALDDDERAVQFARIQANERFTEERLRGFGVRRSF